MADRLVPLAVITGAHGVTGEVRLKVFTPDLARYRSFAVEDGTLTLEQFRPGSKTAVARFAEIKTRNEAEAYRGTELSVLRSALPPLDDGEYYHADLIDLPCISTTGEALGRVVGVENFGAGDIVEIERPGGRRFMVPMRLEAVPEWSGERLIIDATFVE